MPKLKIVSLLLLTLGFSHYSMALPSNQEELVAQIEAGELDQETLNLLESEASFLLGIDFSGWGTWLKGWADWTKEKAKLVTRFGLSAVSNLTSGLGDVVTKTLGDKGVEVVAPFVAAFIVATAAYYFGPTAGAAAGVVSKEISKQITKNAKDLLATWKVNVSEAAYAGAVDVVGKFVGSALNKI